MLSLTGFNLCFTPSRGMFALAFLFILLFTRLGFWQLQRADEKQQLLTRQQAQSVKPATLWQAADPSPLPYQRLIVQGHYLPQVYFLDNQYHQHQFGYDVLSPFLLASGEVVMIDRGWVQGERLRQSLPNIPVPEGEVRVQGSVYYHSKKNWLLDQEFEKKSSSVTVIELIDTKLLNQFLHKSVYPFIIRLSNDEANGYVRDWVVVSMPPTRHFGYALQWFAMAFVILVIFIALNLKKKT